MRLRTGTDAKTIIDAPPRYLLVRADLETEAEEFLAAIQPGTTAEVNPFAGDLKLLVEPRLPTGTWCLFADPARRACLRYAYLSGAERVRVQSPKAGTRRGCPSGASPTSARAGSTCAARSAWRLPDGPDARPAHASP